MPSFFCFLFLLAFTVKNDKGKDEAVKGVVIKLFCFVACNPTVCFVGLTDCGSRVFSLFFWLT